jgi:predicted metal-binding protein
MTTTVYVCTTCRREGDDPAAPRAGAVLAAALANENLAAGSPFTIIPVECLSVCKRPITVGFSAPAKWTYVYGDFPPDAAPAILAAAAQFTAAPDGLIPWRERPEALKRGVVARIPPVLAHPEAAE